MTKYKVYPEYKDSGVEWLGEVPSHWEILSAKRMFQSVRTPAYKSDEQLAASQKYGVIPQSLMMQLNDSKVMLALKGTESFRHVETNNFVISLRSFEGGIEYSQYTGCVSPAYTVLKNSKPISYGYYRYLLKCTPFIAALQSSTDSLRDGKSINYEQFSALSLPLPLVREQNVIASFLDHETAKIDKLIEKQQQLIELLKEKRQAVISHAVTKGLNPDVPMKDSGVEWLGKVPEHWKVTRVKRIASFITSGPRGWSDYISDGGSEIFLQSGDLNNELGLQLDKAKRVSPPKNAEGVRTRLIDGDVVVCITGANTGRVAIASKLSDTTYINQHLSLIRPKELNINSAFLAYCLASSVGRSFFDVVQYGLKEGLSLSNVSDAPLLLPPIYEQDVIVKYLESVNHDYDYLANLSTCQVALLQERRTALISAAVTGKIDVRDWIAPDMQDAEEPQETTA
ncbi:restriction endonuclease subunit S [Serratia bockelmannii]|uniref:restriction endonuclease subunit S n=1 Tax=Serratia bockelmannii TaxID=2703793 RepID=UPI003F7F2746